MPMPPLSPISPSLPPCYRNFKDCLECKPFTDWMLDIINTSGDRHQQQQRPGSGSGQSVSTVDTGLVVELEYDSSDSDTDLDTSERKPLIEETMQETEEEWIQIESQSWPYACTLWDDMVQWTYATGCNVTKVEKPNIQNFYQMLVEYFGSVLYTYAVARKPANISFKTVCHCITAYVKRMGVTPFDLLTAIVYIRRITTRTVGLAFNLTLNSDNICDWAVINLFTATQTNHDIPYDITTWTDMEVKDDPMLADIVITRNPKVFAANQIDFLQVIEYRLYVTQTQAIEELESMFAAAIVTPYDAAWISRDTSTPATLFNVGTLLNASKRTLGLETRT